MACMAQTECMSQTSQHIGVMNKSVRDGLKDSSHHVTYMHAELCSACPCPSPRLSAMFAWHPGLSELPYSTHQL
eukprot:scaffold152430_cov17-Tisochrysis_lutea.AAC.1